MARYRGQKSLYEAMSKTSDKTRPNNILERLRSSPTDKSEPPEAQVETSEAKKETIAPERRIEQPEAKTEVTAPAVPVALPRTWRGPKAVQFNAGRIEVSVPYQLAIAIALGFVLIVMVAYRLGQRSAGVSEGISGTSVRNSSTSGAISGQTTDNPFSNPRTETRVGGTVQTKGDHVIVIVQYGRRADLEPVRQHFTEYGITTQIIQRGNKYSLETVNTYDNPDKSGTNGYLAKQRITEVGARYKGKAPQGYETFAPNYFKDAYGLKLK